MDLGALAVRDGDASKAVSLELLIALECRDRDDVELEAVECGVVPDRLLVAVTREFGNRGDVQMAVR
jgi:hypothetical protein